MESKLEEIWDFVENKNRSDLNVFKLIVDTAKSFPEDDPEYAVKKAINLLHQAMEQFDAPKR